MEEEFEYQGYWWSPEEPQERLPGTLKFDPEEGWHGEVIPRRDPRA